jgi:hypothetical protein
MAERSGPPGGEDNRARLVPAHGTRRALIFWGLEVVAVAVFIFVFSGLHRPIWHRCAAFMVRGDGDLGPRLVQALEARPFMFTHRSSDAEQRAQLAERLAEVEGWDTLLVVPPYGLPDRLVDQPEIRGFWMRQYVASLEGPPSDAAGFEIHAFLEGELVGIARCGSVVCPSSPCLVSRPARR